MPNQRTGRRASSTCAGNSATSQLADLRQLRPYDPGSPHGNDHGTGPIRAGRILGDYGKSKGHPAAALVLGAQSRSERRVSSCPRHPRPRRSGMEIWPDAACLHRGRLRSASKAATISLTCGYRGQCSRLHRHEGRGLHFRPLRRHSEHLPWQKPCLRRESTRTPARPLHWQAALRPF